MSADAGPASAQQRPAWADLAPHLDHLLTLPPLERARQLERIAANEPALGARLSELIGQRDAASRAGFLAGVAEPRWLATALRAGTVLGAWTLQQPIGEGGMGSVWRARRSDGRFEGEAAIKVLARGVFDDTSRERFRREGAILARLDHPGIAKLFDAGVSAQGAPYLVLELVNGELIDHWCDAHRLPVPARIELFLQVLDAVAAAHAQLVIHRDLKPANILVDGRGRVRLLDFGIARLLPGTEDAQGAQTALTREGAFALTPQYAAPEQAQPSAALSTAVDVYALGVVLHELLTGAHPSGLTGAPALAYLRAASEGSPLPASARVLLSAEGAATAAQRAQARDTTPHALARMLKGDLDNIMARALKPLAAERYASVPALADDLRRHLKHEPVSARADGFGYRAAKFLRRHRFGSAAALLLALAVVTGTVGTAWQAAKAQRERDHALTLARRNASLVEFFQSMLTQAAQDERPITVPDLIQRSQALATRGGSDMPDTDAAVLMMLSSLSVEMGQSAIGEKLLADADARLQADRDGGDPALRARLACQRGFVASLRGRVDEARATLAAALLLAGDDPAARAECLLHRAHLAQNLNDAEGALADAQQALVLLRRSGTASPLAEATALGNVAYGHYLAGHTAQADADYAQTIEQFRTLGRSDTPAMLVFLNNWGIASFAAGDIPRAHAVYDEAIAIAQRLAPDRPPPFYLLRNLALADADLGRYDAAMAGLERARATAEADGNATNVALAQAGLSMLLFDLGQTAAAKALSTQARERLGPDLPADSMPAITLLQLDARVALLEGRWAEARERFAAVVDFFDRRGMQVGPVVSALRHRAEAHWRSGSPDAAAADVERALILARKLQGDKPYSSHTGRALWALHRLQRVRGQADEARRSAALAAEHLERALGAEHAETRKAVAATSDRDTP